MLVLFSTQDPAHPDKPAVDRLINSRYVVDVEPVYAGESFQPVASLMRLVEKRVYRLDGISPREVEAKFRSAGAR